MGAKEKNKRQTQLERRELSEKKILDAALKLLAAEGYEGFTLAQLAKNAGVSRGLPAHYFSSKENLMRIVAERIIQQGRVRFDAIDSKNGGLETYISFVLTYFSELDQRKTNIKALFAIFAASFYRPEVATVVAQSHRDIVSSGVENLQQGVELGHVGKHVDLAKESADILIFRRGLMMLKLADPDFDVMPLVENHVKNLRARLRPRDEFTEN